MPKKPSAQQLMDELRELQACRSAVTDLTEPSKDLADVRREKFSVLMSFLDRQNERVLVEFDRILRPE